MAYNYEFPYTDPNHYNADWLLKKVKSLVDDIQQIKDWQTEHEEAFDGLMELYNQLIAGNFPPELEQAFSNWMSRNAIDLVGELVKMVFFGITDDGYFVAYIPEYWDDIIFNTTGYDIAIAGFDFGHLTLSFNVGGA